MYIAAMLASAAHGAFFRPRANMVGLHDLAIVKTVAVILLLALSVADRSLPRIDRAVRERR
ncbi:hypothetical protein [Paramicrobacterium humi]|uniref:hypothetical protein n=1 Tax=Paramicrobacterium humi TaxID=640635 RepID=UPI00115FD004|nr:hypothetical protein [Microbacterium humi]